ncbi:MAG: NADH:ubiquinone reductase (Na(+)-transporting) subunit A, partial [Spongiibacteraceae bacterium]
MIRIKRGLTLPISGEPEQVVHDAPAPTRVAVLPADYPGLELQPCVTAGERVRTGQPLLRDVRNARDMRLTSVQIVAPATGRIECVYANDGVTLDALTIVVEADEFIEFPAISAADLPNMGRARIVAQLLLAGLWPAFRTRPFQNIPRPDICPHAIFVTAMDTQPLAVRADWLIQSVQAAFDQGLAAISQLTNGLVYVCKAPAAYVPVPDIENIKVEEFAGPHPAGLAGTHIHYLDPVGVHDDKQVWSIGYQDVIAIGKLFSEGRYNPERVIALAGPQMIDPRLLRIRLGANIAELCAGQLREGATQLLAGSVFGGIDASGEQVFLGRDYLQITALRAPETTARDWLRGGLHQFSLLPIFFSRLVHGRRYRFAATPPQPRLPLLPTAAFEKIWPLRLLHLPLLRALIAGDDERAIQLGAL